MKKNSGLVVFCVAFLTGAVLISPAFAEMKKIDEAELARTHASVTGASAKDRIAGAKKGTIRPETEQTIVNADKGTSALLLSGSKAASGLSLNLNVSGQETWQFNFGNYNTNYYGGVTGVKTY